MHSTRARLILQPDYETRRSCQSWTRWCRRELLRRGRRCTGCSSPAGCAGSATPTRCCGRSRATAGADRPTGTKQIQRWPAGTRVWSASTSDSSQAFTDIGVFDIQTFLWLKLFCRLYLLTSDAQVTEVSEIWKDFITNLNEKQSLRQKATIIMKIWPYNLHLAKEL